MVKASLSFANISVTYDPGPVTQVVLRRLAVEPIISITTTTDKRDTLEEIGRSLVAKRLVACIQIVGPIKSIYWWKDKVEEAEEWLGIMKTRKSLYPRVEEEIRTLHTYELPEIVAFDLSDLLPPYSDWVLKETRVEQGT